MYCLKWGCFETGSLLRKWTHFHFTFYEPHGSVRWHKPFSIIMFSVGSYELTRLCYYFIIKCSVMTSKWPKLHSWTSHLGCWTPFKEQTWVHAVMPCALISPQNNASKLLLAIMESRHDSENAERILYNMRPKELVCMSIWLAAHVLNGFYLIANILAGGSD